MEIVLQPECHLKIPDKSVVEVPQVSLDVRVEIVQRLALHRPQVLVVEVEAPPLLVTFSF